MNPKSPDRLLALIVIVVGAAVGLIAWDNYAVGSTAERSHKLQQLVRGIRLGPAVATSWCAFRFDPRVYSDWRTAHDPVLCGEYFCPGHASSIFYVAPLDDRPASGGQDECK